jgi:hypothetical protein
MTQDELIEEARIRLDDNEAPYQYSDAILERWLNEGLIEACRRSRIISGSDELILVTPGVSTYDLPENAYLVHRAKLASTDYSLEFTSYKVLDADCPGWESYTGTPTHIFTDMGSNRLTLFPQPIAADTLNLVCIKEPYSVLDIPVRFRYGLVDWVCYRGYQVRDSDMESRNKSLEHYTLFEQEYGERSSAKDEIFNLRQRPFNNFDGFY